MDNIKNMIKPGMVVVYKDGVVALVIEVEIYDQLHTVLLDNTGYNFLDAYDSNLNLEPKIAKTMFEPEMFSIDEIYDTCGKFGLGTAIVDKDSLKFFKLIWKRY